MFKLTHKQEDNIEKLILAGEIGMLKSIRFCGVFKDTRGHKRFIGTGFTFSLQILFLFENGKPLVASSEWNFHFQNEISIVGV